MVTYFTLLSMPLKITKESLNHLGKDSVLSEIIQLIPPPQPIIKEDLFHALVNSIISQQLSTKAAATILKRYEEALGKECYKPAQVLKIEDQTIRSCGVSGQKTKYIKNVAEFFLDKPRNASYWAQLPDEDFVNQMIQIKGVGNWTIHMMQIFSLGRPDIFPEGDQGIKNAMARVYNLESDNVARMLEISSQWSPFRSIGSLYMWASLEL